MAKHSIRIDYAEGDELPTVTVTASCPFGKDQMARISFPINFDEGKPTPQPKQRKDETDEQYSARLTQINPTAIDLPVAYASGLTERLKEIIEAVSDIGNHFGTRAAATHTLSSQGKAPPGVKTLKIDRKLDAPITNTNTSKTKK